MITILVIYILILLLLGVYFRKERTTNGFILADRRLNFPLLVGSIVATFYGATAVLGGAELSFYFGLGALWFMVPFYLGNLFVLKLLDKVKKSSAKTLPDFLGDYYNSNLVIASSLLLAVLCLVPASILAIGKIMHLILPYSPEGWMIIVTFVVILYTMLGGMRSVVYSDLLQFILMVLSLLILLPFALNFSPDFLSEVPPENLNPINYFRMFPQDAIRWTILLLFLPITSAPLYQRFFSSMEKVDIKKAMILAVVIYFGIDVILLTGGMVANVNALSLGIDEKNADISVVILGVYVLPPALKAFFILGLLAAIMSTADSWIHSGASSLSYDVVRRIFNLEEGKLVLVSRLFTVILGLGSLILAIYFFDIIEALTALLTVWISGILIPTMSALLGVKLKENAALLSLIFGALGSVLWITHPLTELDPLFIGLGCSVIGVILGRWCI